MNTKRYLTVIFLVMCSLVKAQDKYSDSLFSVLKTAKHDSTKLYTLMELGSFYATKDPDTANYFNNLALVIAGKLRDDLSKIKTTIELGGNNYVLGHYDKAISLFISARDLAETNIAKATDLKVKKRFKKVLSPAISNLALLYMRQANYSEALKFFSLALQLNGELENKKGQASNLGNIGIVYDEQGNYPKALDYYFRALKMSEEIGLKAGQSANLANIGIVYFGEGDHTKALEYYFKALKINREIGNRVNEGNNLGSIGSVYMEQNKFSNALEYFLKAQKIYVESGNQQGLANVFNNIGNVFMSRGDSAAANGRSSNEAYALSLTNHMKAMKINEELGNKNGLGVNYVNLGMLYKTLKQYERAEQYLLKSNELAKEIHSLDELRYVNESLSQLYEATSRPGLALKHFRLFIHYRDSLLNEESTRSSIQQEMKFNYGKKAAADSLKADGEKKVIAVQLQHEQSQRYFLYGGLALVLVFAGFMFNRFQVTNKQKLIIEAKERETQKQNEIISRQKHEVEEKQKEILDSIRYAKRIQSSLLPQEKMIEKVLKKLRES